MKFRSPFAIEILKYIAGRPKGRDSLEGILHWWLVERLVAIHQPEVVASVEELVEKGFLLVEGIRRPTYRLNPNADLSGMEGAAP